MFKPDKRQTRLIATVLIALAAGVSALWNHYQDTATGAGAEQVALAFEQGRSNLWVELGARVERVLKDDNDGSRHQRFVLRLAENHTVLVAHNIDLAERVPLREGDWVELRGEYEWSSKGGVLHWTHHDPDGRRRGGWIRHNGVLFE